MPNNPGSWIAEQAVVFVHPDGRRVHGRIAVGLPTRVSEVESRCPVILEGLEAFPDICGDSTLQALLLALRLVARRLHHFSERGGRIEYPEDEGGEVALDAIFGSLYRE